METPSCQYSFPRVNHLKITSSTLLSMISSYHYLVELSRELGTTLFLSQSNTQGIETILFLLF